MNIKEQRNVSFSPPDITDAEINAVAEVMRSGWITTGPVTKSFEKQIADYIGVHKAVCLSSATSALELTLRILGIGEGDEVITSAYTYTATAAVIRHVGAEIVLVDTSHDSFEMDYNTLADAITPYTKAIIAADIGGMMCDYAAITKIALQQCGRFKADSALQKRLGRIAVISDSAHGFGATREGVMSGLAADFTCYSFHAVKNLTTAEGGAVVWRDISGVDSDWLYDEFMRYSMHGQTKDALSKMQSGGWIYDVVYPAYKCNMTDITAAIGLVQLKRYDSFLRRRHEIIEMYEHAFVPLGIWTLQHYGYDFMSSGHLFMARIPGMGHTQRNELICRMAERGIACNVHYRPLPMLTAYKELGFDIREFPHSFEMYENEITLPLHTKLSNNDVEYVIDCFANLSEEYIDDRKSGV